MNGASFSYHTLMINFYTGINGAIISHNCAVSDRNMRIDGAVVTNPAIITNISIRAYVSVSADLSGRFNDCCGMNSLFSRSGLINKTQK